MGILKDIFGKRFLAIMRQIWRTILSKLPFTGRGYRKYVPSGFLSNYADLKPLPEDKAILYYEKPGVDWGQYNAVIIDTVETRLSKRTKKKRKISPGKLGELADYFYNKVVETLKDEFPVVDKPAPGVMRIRAAITDVAPGNIFINFITSFFVWLPLYLGSADMEAEFFDASTGESLGAIIDRRKGSPFGFIRGYTKWGHAKTAFDIWAKELKFALLNPEGK